MDPLLNNENFVSDYIFTFQNNKDGMDDDKMTYKNMSN